MARYALSVGNAAGYWMGFLEELHPRKTFTLDIDEAAWMTRDDALRVRESLENDDHMVSLVLERQVHPNPPGRPPPRPPSPGRPRSALETAQRMSYEHQRDEKPFDPARSYPRGTRAHHFSVNPGDIDTDLDSFEEDILSAENEAIMGEGGEDRILPFVRQKAGLLMMNWHSGQNDPIYAVGSFYFEGEPYPSTEIVSDAKESLSNILEFHSDEHEEEDLRELELLVQFLEWDLENNYYGVNG